MGERVINPLFNVHEEYRKMRIINPYRFGAAAATTLKTGLLSCWELDEASGTTVNDAHGTNHGTNSGAVVNQTGKINKAYDFEAGDNDFLYFGDVFDFEYTDAFSVSTWIKFESTSGYQVLWCKMVAGGNYNGYQLYYYNNTFRFDIQNDNSPANGLSKTFNKSSSTATWYNGILTYDGSNTLAGVKLYIDDTEVTSIGATVENLSATVLNNENFRIGGRDAGTAFDGLIDQTAVWSRVLTSTEVSLLYNSGNGLAYASW